LPSAPVSTVDRPVESLVLHYNDLAEAIVDRVLARVR
jgi:hypothetical protein